MRCGAGGPAAHAAGGLERIQEHVEGGPRWSYSDVGVNAAAHAHSDALWWGGKEKGKEAMVRERRSHSSCGEDNRSCGGGGLTWPASA